jgi:hypothetical protein
MRLAYAADKFRDGAVVGMPLVFRQRFSRFEDCVKRDIAGAVAWFEFGGHFELDEPRNHGSKRFELCLRQTRVLRLRRSFGEVLELEQDDMLDQGGDLKSNLPEAQLRIALCFR